MVAKESARVNLPNSKKEHMRSNSTLSKKSFKDPKSCFKIDLSKLVGKDEKQRENKIMIEKQGKVDNEVKEVNRGSFYFDYVIGKGGFGKVWSVEMKKNSKLYAMKEMNKTNIIAKKSIHSVLN